MRFHGLRHPATLGCDEIEAFVSWLANERRDSASTHRQALAAMLFLYGKVMGVKRGVESASKRQAGQAAYLAPFLLAGHCYAAVTTSAWCKSCSVIGMSRPR